MCLSGQTLSENTEFTSYSHHIRAEKTLFLIQTWKDNTIGYIRAPSGLIEGPDHRPLPPPSLPPPTPQAPLSPISHRNTATTKSQAWPRPCSSQTLLSHHKRRKWELCAHRSAPTFTSRGALITELDKHLWREARMRVWSWEWWIVTCSIWHSLWAVSQLFTQSLHKFCTFHHK